MLRTHWPRAAGGLLTCCAAALAAASATAQDQPPAKSAAQQSGPGKVLGLPAPARPKEDRDKRLVLPRRLRSGVQKKTQRPAPVPVVADGEGELADFVASLVSDKDLTTAELVAEYSLLAETERRALTLRAHRLPTLAIGRLARVYRAVPEPTGVPALLTVLHSRKLGKLTRAIVEDALFLSGDKAKLVGLDLLASRYRGVRDAAGRFVAHILERRDLPQLRLLLDHDAQGTRLAALRVLATWLVEHPGEPTTPLVRCLRHSDGTLRTQAARYLAERGDAVLPALVRIVEGPPQDSSFFLASLLIARRELVGGKDLLPAAVLNRLARYRFGVETMPRGIAFLVAAMRWFRDPGGFRQRGGALAAVDAGEIIQELLRVAEVRGFYPEFPICQDTALLCLRLLSGEDFGADHRRWRAWWAAAKETFRPLRRDVRIDATNAARSRIAYYAGGALEFVVLGRDAAEPPVAAGGFRCRTGDDDLVALAKMLADQGFGNLGERLREVGNLTEGRFLVVDGPQGRARDGFANARSLRLRVFLNVFEKTLAREAWQEYVPQGLDAEGRKAWWVAERGKLAALSTDADRRAHVLDLALQAMPHLGREAQRRAIGAFLDEAGRKDGRLGAAHAVGLLALVDGKAVARDTKRSVFEVLARIPDAPFHDVLTVLSRQQDLNTDEVLRRMLAIAGTDRVLVALHHELPDIRANAAGQVASLGSPRAIPALVACLDDRDFAVRTRAVESCGKLRLAAVRPKILALLKDDEAPVRQAAILALARIGGADTYEVLLRAADPARPSERLAAVHALTLLQDPRAGVALADLAAGHYGTPIGMMALRGLRKRGGKGVRARVWKFLQASDNPELRHEFTFLLGEMGDPGVFEQLLRMLEAGDSPARACRLLAGISGIDWCGHRDRVKRYRDWLDRHAGETPATWIFEALAAAKMPARLAPTQLVSGAGQPVVDELCRIIDEAKERAWPLRVLALNVLRDVTGQDFGTIQRGTSLGARQAITERYRALARAREAAGRK